MSKEWLERTCPICGESFFTTNSRRVYCSKECARRKDYHKPEPKQPKRCEVCGKEFVPVSIKRRYCSKDCSLKAWRARHPYDAEADREREHRNYAEYEGMAKVAVAALSEEQRDKLRCILTPTVRTQYWARYVKRWVESGDGPALRRLRKEMG